MTMALPVPPAPTTRTRTARWWIRSGGSVCSIRILPPLTAHELRQRLGQLDQSLNRKHFAFIEAAPQSFKPSRVAGQAAHIGVGERAFLEAALPLGNALHVSGIGVSHRSKANPFIIPQIPKRDHSQVPC